MEYKKALLGAASLLALSAGLNQPTQAALRVEQSAKTANSAAVAAGQFGDPLLALIARTNGSLSPEVIEDTVIEMFANPTVAGVTEIPKLLKDLASIGVSASSITAIKRALADIIHASEIDESVRQSVLLVLEEGAGPIQLAQSRRRRDPAATGAIGGGGYR